MPAIRAMIDTMTISFGQSVLFPILDFFLKYRVGGI